jgi:hypothetical protein
MGPQNEGPGLSRQRDTEPNGIQQSLSDSPSPSQFQASCTALAVVADWKDDLQAKIDRAQLRFELIGFESDGEVDELAKLVEEVSAFKSCCRVLGWRPSRRASV